MNSKPLVESPPDVSLLCTTVHSLLPYRNSSNYLLLAPDVLDGWEQYKELLGRKFGDKSFFWRIYFPLIQKYEDKRFACPDALVNYLSGDGFAESVYMGDQEGSVLVYSNNRDSFSFASVNKAIVDSSTLLEWDDNFVRHLRAGGVGFGKEGQSYIVGLITELSKTDDCFRVRGEKLLKLIHRPA